MVLVRVEQGEDGYLKLKLIDPNAKMEGGKDVVYDLCLTDDPNLNQIKNDIDTVRDDIGAIDHHWHSRSRIYPQDVSVAGTQLVAAAAVNTFGAWVEIVPLNTIPFKFEVTGMVVEQVGAAETYHIQIGYNTVNSDPGANMELGERRVRIAGVPIARETELLTISSQDVPENSRIMGRVKTGSGNPDWIRVSVVVYRHVEVSRQVPLWPAFPW